MQGIIFDFYGVICTEIGMPWFKKYFPPDISSVMKDRYCQPADLGTLSETAFFEELGTVAHQSGAAVRAEWLSRVSIDQSVLSLMSKLKPTYKLGLLSNSQSQLIREILSAHELEHFFDEIVVSSEIGMIKPDPNIFRSMLAKLEVESNQAVFIDDNLHNVTAAEHVGIKSFLFTESKKLEEDLRACQIRF